MTPRVTEAAAREDVHGRGGREGRRLFEEWYAGFAGAEERGEKSAYVFVMGSLVELLRCFDFQIVFPEINSLQTAVRKVADEYLNLAEDHGFSPDVCGYVKADYAVQLRGGDHPMGRIPRPSVAVLTNACCTYIKWAEIWERLYEVPTLTVDVPGSRRPVPLGRLGGARAAEGKGATDPRAGGGEGNGGADDAQALAVPEADCRYVEHQLRELIEVCERVSGVRFDIDRCREVMRLTNEMGRWWRRVLELNRHLPAPFDAMLEGTVYLGVANALRGTEAGATYFRELVEELEARVADGRGPRGEADERHRLIFVGVPCYPIFRRFYELFGEWGGTFVSSTYTWFASGGLNLGFEYDLDDPLASLAEGVVRGVREATDSLMFPDRALLGAIDEYGADGVVYHPVKSCRTVSTGLAASRRVILESRDVLALYIESDMMDKRVVSEAQLKNRIDAFFEGLRSRELRLAGSEGPTA